MSLLNATPGTAAKRRGSGIPEKLRNALFTRGLFLVSGPGGNSSWEPEGTWNFSDIDTQSARRFHKLHAGNGPGVLRTMLRDCDSGTCAAWFAASMVGSRGPWPRNFPEDPGSFSGLVTPMGEILLKTPEGLDWAAADEANLRVVRFLLTGSDASVPEVTVADSDFGIQAIQAAFAQEGETWQKADRARHLINALPVSRVAAEALSIVALSDDPLYRRVSVAALSQRMADWNIGEALAFHEKVKSELGVTVNIHNIIRHLMDSQPYEASRMLDRMDPGPAKDELIVPLIQTGGLSDAERIAWAQALSDPKLRAEYDKTGNE